eukprot:c4885_g1_i1.p1 GENE.c4885_g1_i1~~c4885_g1_i1.p1  ORF type:complete len:159 (+),score=48.67 c4885_g1_i1:45-479(+)
MKVQDFMIAQDKLVVATPDASILDVSKLMVEKKVSAIVVVNHAGAGMHAVGIITKTDVLRAVVESKDLTTKVETIMSTTIATVALDTPRDVAAEEIMKHKVHHLLVVSGADNKLEGIISAWDIAREVTLDGKAWPYNRDLLKYL